MIAPWLCLSRSRERIPPGARRLPRTPAGRRDPAHVFGPHPPAPFSVAAQFIFSRVGQRPFSSLSGANPAAALDRVTFATNWRAEAEHGGFYQALAEGTYAKYGLDVTILQGGPQSNSRLLLAAGGIDFDMGANMIQAFSAAEQNVPIVAVAALFQKDPFILMSHPGHGLDRFRDLPKASTYFLGNDALVSVFQWLERSYGFSPDKVKPYTFNSAPFVANKTSIQQGYATSEPFAIEQEAGF